MSEQRNGHLTVLLLRTEARPPNECIHDLHNHRAAAPRLDSGIVGTFYLQEPRPPT